MSFGVERKEKPPEVVAVVAGAASLETGVKAGKPKLKVGVLKAEVFVGSLLAETAMSLVSFAKVITSVDGVVSVETTAEPNLKTGRPVVNDKESLLEATIESGLSLVSLEVEGKPKLIGLTVSEGSFAAGAPNLKTGVEVIVESIFGGTTDSVLSSTKLFLSPNWNPLSMAGGSLGFFLGFLHAIHRSEA